VLAVEHELDVDLGAVELEGPDGVVVQCCSGRPRRKRQPRAGGESGSPARGHPRVMISPGCSTPSAANVGAVRVKLAMRGVSRRMPVTVGLNGDVRARLSARGAATTTHARETLEARRVLPRAARARRQRRPEGCGDRAR
jgi:hypothetical protein